MSGNWSDPLPYNLLRCSVAEGVRNANAHTAHSRSCRKHMIEHNHTYMHTEAHA